MPDLTPTPLKDAGQGGRAGVGSAGSAFAARGRPATLSIPGVHIRIDSLVVAGVAPQTQQAMLGWLQRELRAGLAQASGFGEDRAVQSLRVVAPSGTDTGDARALARALAQRILEELHG